jgi:hypothetical protein
MCATCGCDKPSPGEIIPLPEEVEEVEKGE